MTSHRPRPRFHPTLSTPPLPGRLRLVSKGSEYELHDVMTGEAEGISLDELSRAISLTEYF
jgi:hypothetical protein